MVESKLLRKKLKNGLIVDKWDLVTIIEKQQAEIEELKAHPTELTDEEIEEVIKTSTIKISGLEAYDYCYPQNYRLDEKLFARAILRKAQEK